MRKSLIALTALFTAAGAVALNMKQPLNLQHPNEQIGKADPSFPQAGSFAGIDRPVSKVGMPGATLAEALTVDRKAGVWWDYARDVSSITARLSERGAKDTTIFVPIDSAIMRLPRKPHQSVEGGDTEESMKKNVETFLAAHIVPGSIQLPTAEPAQTLLDGCKLEVVKDDGEENGWKVRPGDISVLDVKEAANGRILYLDGVISC